MRAIITHRYRCRVADPDQVRDALLRRRRFATAVLCAALGVAVVGCGVGGSVNSDPLTKEIGHASDAAQDADEWITQERPSASTATDETTFQMLMEGRVDEVGVRELRAAIRRLHASFRPAHKAIEDSRRQRQGVRAAEIDLSQYPEASDVATSLATDMNDMLDRYERYLTGAERAVRVGLRFEPVSRKALEDALAYKQGHLSADEYQSRTSTAAKQLVSLAKRVDDQIQSVRSVDDPGRLLESIRKTANRDDDAGAIVQAVIDNYPDGILAKHLHR